MFSATSDLGKSKFGSDKKPPGEMLKLIYLIPNNYIRGLRYSDLLFVTRVTATNKNFSLNGVPT